MALRYRIVVVLLGLCGLAAPLWSQDVTADPAEIHLVPGGEPVKVVLRGKGVSEVTSAVVVDGRGAVTRVNSTLGPLTQDFRTVTLSAVAGTRAARGYTLRLMAGRLAIDVRTSIEIAEPVSLVRIEIDGPSIVDESSTVQYQVRGVFSDGSTSTVDATWSVVPPEGAALLPSGLEAPVPAEISISGLLSAGAVSADASVAIAAEHRAADGIQKATLEVTIRDPGFQPVSISTDTIKATGLRWPE